MVHFAIEPGRAAVDIVYFHAEPLLAKGLDAATLPPEPATIGEMKPGVWYYTTAPGRSPSTASGWARSCSSSAWRCADR